MLYGEDISRIDERTAENQKKEDFIYISKHESFIRLECI